MKKPGEYITCITNKHCENSAWKYLTKGKQYVIIDNKDKYTILDDSGDIYSFPIKQFHTIEELRDMKLHKLLE
jgi:hypothetical protein